VVLAYVWIILGLFWVGMPFVLRDQAAWATKSDGRFKALALGGVVYGVVLVACALAFWGDAVRS
jgi:cytochrome c biogenesis protein CcdA